MGCGVIERADVCRTNGGITGEALISYALNIPLSYGFSPAVCNKGFHESSITFTPVSITVFFQ